MQENDELRSRLERLEERVLSSRTDQGGSRERVEVIEETQTEKGKQAQHTVVESVRGAPGRKRK